MLRKSKSGPQQLMKLPISFIWMEFPIGFAVVLCTKVYRNGSNYAAALCTKQTINSSNYAAVLCVRQQHMLLLILVLFSEQNNTIFAAGFGVFFDQTSLEKAAYCCCFMHKIAGYLLLVLVLAFFGHKTALKTAAIIWLPVYKRFCFLPLWSS